MATALPTTGDLRTLISLVRSARTPIANSEFQQTLTPFLAPWSKRELAARTFIGGKDTDSAATHVFWIRNPGVSIEARDYVRDGNELFAVAKVEPKGSRQEFLKLHVIYHKDLTGAEVPDGAGVITLNPGTLPDPASDAPAGASGNDFFFPA